MISIQAPRPINGACAEDQCPARCAIQAQVMRRDASADGVVIEEIRRNRKCGCRQWNQARRAESIVIVHIPFVTENSGRQRGDLAGCKGRDTRVSPESHPAVCLGHGNGIAAKGINPGECPTQGVLRAAPVGGWTKPPVPPQARPCGWIGGVERVILVRFFVTD